jgi:hypothetical protein
MNDRLKGIIGARLTKLLPMPAFDDGNFATL